MTPEIIHLLFTLVGAVWAGTSATGAGSLPPEVAALAQALLARRNERTAQDLLQELLGPPTPPAPKV